VAIILKLGFAAAVVLTAEVTKSRAETQLDQKPLSPSQPAHKSIVSKAKLRSVRSFSKDSVPRNERTMSWFVVSTARKPVVSVLGVLWSCQ
jgi:hypothetical protein